MYAYIVHKSNLDQYFHKFFNDILHIFSFNFVQATAKRILNKNWNISINNIKIIHKSNIFHNHFIYVPKIYTQIFICIMEVWRIVVKTLVKTHTHILEKKISCDILFWSRWTMPPLVYTCLTTSHFTGDLSFLSKLCVSIYTLNMFSLQKCFFPLKFRVSLHLFPFGFFFYLLCSLHSITANWSVFSYIKCMGVFVLTVLDDDERAVIIFTTGHISHHIFAYGIYEYIIYIHI